MSDYKEELKKQIFDKYESRVSIVNRTGWSVFALGAVLGTASCTYEYRNLENPYKNAIEVVELENFKFSKTDLRQGLKEVMERSQDKYILKEDLLKMLNEQEIISDRQVNK